MSAEIRFTKENLDACLRELAKEFSRLNGRKMPAELILVGGASVLANYGFRNTTYDVDAIIRASSAMEDAIRRVGDTLHLPNGWLNSDFTRTKSYSPRLAQYSVYYKTFSRVLEVRTISGEYLVAMKLMSCRQYKNDISDIAGILWEQQKRGKPISFEDIDRAVCNLYDSWESFPTEAKPLIRKILKSDCLEELYRQSREEEEAAREMLVDFTQEYKPAAEKDNLNEIIASLKARQKGHPANEKN